MATMYTVGIVILTISIYEAMKGTAKDFIDKRLKPEDIPDAE